VDIFIYKKEEKEEEAEKLEMRRRVIVDTRCFGE
jgi:hypothetical protein